MARVRENRPTRASVAERKVESRALITFNSDDPIWLGHVVDVPSGSIIRLIPPVGFPDLHAESIAQGLRDGGAARVKIVARPRTAVVPAPERRAAGPRASARETVMRMAGEARTANRPALVALLDARLSEHGL